MAIARKMTAFMERSSFIRKMFDEGTRLKKIHGPENVFDFSLGNPNVPPPPAVKECLVEIASSLTGTMHGYMPNAGFPETRAAVAAYLRSEQGVPVGPEHVVMTVGASGALNVILKALLDPGDDVLSPIPCFVEYGFYVDNHGGTLTTVPTNPDFTLDIDAIGRAIGLRTKVVLVNSPNNPTGRVYSEAELSALAAMLRERSRAIGRTIYLVADEPYRKIVYDGHEVPSVFAHYEHSLVVTSYSKDLCIPGERLGFGAVHPGAEDAEALVNAMILANRILGFVNAPALQQRLVCGLQGACVEVDIYKRKRDRLVSALRSFGYDVVNPQGAFYLFPRSPLQNDVEFVALLQEENILVVPGSGFAGPGHFRIAYCVSDETVEGALPGFERAIRKARAKGGA